MPTVYRAMKPDEDGKPKVATSGCCLGARVSGLKKDVVPDKDGRVHPGKGISVNPSWRTIPMTMLPIGFRDPDRPGLRNNTKIRVFRLGVGPFEDGPIGADLALTVDPPRRQEASSTHGEIGPDRPMRLNDYQGALASTRDQWNEVEPPR